MVGETLRFWSEMQRLSKNGKNHFLKQKNINEVTFLADFQLSSLAAVAQKHFFRGCTGRFWGSSKISSFFSFLQFQIFLLFSDCSLSFALFR